MTLEEIYLKIEQKRLQKLEEERLLEEKYLEEREKQRQLILQERKIYENISFSNSNSSSSAGHRTISTLSVTPSNQNVTYLSGTTTFNITSNYKWTATCNQSWCTISPSNGTGNGIITAIFTNNILSTSRTANIIVKVSTLTFTVTIIQQPTIAPVSPTQLTHNYTDTQIIWNWSNVDNSTGYKIGITNVYSNATDLGLIHTYTETNLSGNTTYTRYVWAYNMIGPSPVLILSGTTLMSDTQINSTFGSRLAVWTKSGGTDETNSYFINKIGSQDRLSISENNGTFGVVHPGRGISYDRAKTQYSVTNGNMPTNFKLSNNSITLSGWCKIMTLPAGINNLIFGSPYASASGRYYVVVTSDKNIRVEINGTKSGSLNMIRYDYPIELGVWYHVCLSIDTNNGNYVLYVTPYGYDSVFDWVTSSLSGFTFSDVAIPFYLGGYGVTTSGVSVIRDVRLFNSALSPTDVLNLYKQEYVAGSIAWWPLEENKAGNMNSGSTTTAPYPIRDCVGSNHLLNYNFDNTSLVNGKWPSLLNKYGYTTLENLGVDLLQGRGTFTTSTGWSPDGAFSVSGGKLNYSGNPTTGSAAPYYDAYLGSNLVKGKTYRVQFTVGGVANGSVATIAIYRANSYTPTTLLYSGTFGNGVQNIYYIPDTGLSQLHLAIYGTTNVVFTIDDVTFVPYDGGIISPLLNSGTPTTDPYSRPLTFVGQAKYNLLKVGSTAVILQDNVSELINSTLPTTVNTWYDNTGVAQQINLTNIYGYQYANQYYNNGTLLLLKQGSIITDREDTILKAYAGIPNSLNFKVQWINDFARISFYDISNGVSTYELWESVSGGTYSLAHTFNTGETSYDYYTWFTASLKYKLRPVTNGTPGSYTPELYIKSPWVFKSDQSVLTSVLIKEIQPVIGKRLIINWGDGTTLNVSSDLHAIQKDYTIQQNPYFIQIGGDIDQLYWIDMPYNYTRLYGDLTKLLLPSTLYAFHMYFNNFTGDISHVLMNLPSGIRIFHIENNQLTGDVTNFDPSRLLVFDDCHLANNYLTGDISNWKFHNPFPAVQPSTEGHITLKQYTNTLTGNLTNWTLCSGMSMLTITNFVADITNWVIPSTLCVFRGDSSGITGNITNFILPTVVRQNEGFSWSFNNAQVSGDLSGWIIPSGIGVPGAGFLTMSFENCNLSKLPGGAFDNLATYDFLNNQCNSTEIDRILALIDAYFTSGMAPKTSCTYNLSGTRMGIPSSTGLSHITSIISKYITAGKIATIIVNS